MSNNQDRVILNSVFNPLLPLGECPYDADIPEDLKDEEEETPEILEARNLEMQAVKTAECGDVDKALLIFTKAIQMAPQRPSGYNNRAQAFRLKGDISSALQDLNNSINLCEGKGRSGCLSYCQRALIHRLHGQDEKAKDDFKMAAQMGSEFAKAQLVQMNPYAALCNQMLSKVFSQYQEGAMRE